MPNADPPDPFRTNQPGEPGRPSWPSWPGWPGWPGALAVLGLSATEETAYELLVEHSPATTADLAEHWALPGPLPDVLVALEVRGLVTVTRAPDEADRYMAVPPDVAFGALLLDYERQVGAAEAHVEQLALTHASPAPLPQPLTELVIGSGAVQQRIEALYRATRHELRRLCTDVSTPDPPDHPVACRSVYTRDSLTVPGAFTQVEGRAGTGEQARTAPTVPCTLHLADARLALLSLEHEPDGTTAALIVYPSGMLDALGAMFEVLWDQATPLPLVADEPPAHPTDATDRPSGDTQLVALLLSSGTDLAAARQLGIARRTLARRIAALMTELGAHTRFQAGVQAAFRDLGGHPDRPRSAQARHRRAGRVGPPRATDPRP